MARFVLIPLLLSLLSCGRSVFENEIKLGSGSVTISQNDYLSVDDLELKLLASDLKLYDENILKIDVLNNTQFDKSKYEIYLWMPEHGHGSFPISVNVVDHDIELRDVYFTMPGKWELIVKNTSTGKMIKWTINL